MTDLDGTNPVKDEQRKQLVTPISGVNKRRLINFVSDDKRVSHGKSPTSDAAHVHQNCSRGFKADGKRAEKARGRNVTHSGSGHK